MKRKIWIQTEYLTITAIINTGKNGHLMTGEVESARDDIADKLMILTSNARYVGSPLNKIKVK